MSASEREVSSGNKGEMALIGGAAALILLLLVLLFGGALAGLVFGGGWAWPAVDRLAPTLIGIARHGSDPAQGYDPGLGQRIPGAVPFWVTVLVCMGVVAMAATVLVVAIASRRTRVGMATRMDVKRAMKQPDTSAPYGTYHGLEVKARTGDAALVIAPQQAGKTTRLAVGRIVDAPGAVVATSTKADLVDLTIFARRERDDAEVSVFDPDGVVGWPTHCKWNIVERCGEAREAKSRARAMVAARPLGKAGNASFFEGASETVLRCLLHAAALSGQSMADVLRWARDFSDDEPYTILQHNPAAIQGWYDDLRQFCRAGAPETVSSTGMSLQLVLDSLSDPAVLELVCPGRGEGFDIDRFLERGTDTIYLISEGGEDVSTAPIVTAFASAIVSGARRASQQRPSRKLDPILTLVLDELANVAPLPQLGMMMSDGGGRGMSTWGFVQSFGQLRQRWTSDGAATIWGSTSIKMLLGGCTETDDLDRISRIIGERRVERRSYTNTGMWGSASPSTSVSSERERTMPVEDISRMPVGKALLLYRAMPAAVISLDGWWERKDAAAFKNSLDRSSEVTGRREVAA